MNEPVRNGIPHWIHPQTAAVIIAMVKRMAMDASLSCVFGNNLHAMQGSGSRISPLTSNDMRTEVTNYVGSVVEEIITDMLKLGSPDEVMALSGHTKQYSYTGTTLDATNPFKKYFTKEPKPSNINDLHLIDSLRAGLGFLPIMLTAASKIDPTAQVTPIPIKNPGSLVP